MPTKKSKTSNNTLKNQNNKTVTMSKNSDKRKKLDESNVNTNSFPTPN